MKTMKAVLAKQYGGPEVLSYEDAPVPALKPDQVLVRVRAAGVNPLDWKLREGELKEQVPLPLPFAPGSDFAGVVEGIYPSATAHPPEVEINAEVYGSSFVGAYAELVAVPISALAPKPKSLDFVEAASVPVVAVTAWQALFDHGKLEKGQTVLIHGGAGGVGQLAIQMAKRAGAHVITTAGTDSLDYVRERGADQAIDYKTQRFEDLAKDVDLVLDTIGGETQERSFEVLKSGGRLIATAQPPSQEKAQAKGVHAEMFMAQPTSELLSQIAGLIDAGEFKIEVGRVLPIAQAVEAQELAQKGHVRGKIVLQVG